ncbi:hypothetical protein EMPG_09330 [Blastomyces silverae]|uniref:Uncharacterized protein n=1 Tax=Blastomyces silverae TaxID=2060906 RepID=A0A0H1B8N2_9EURO|nr:hypothetical protein EMPG_09330 [Blastomyces silverae]
MQIWRANPFSHQPPVVVHPGLHPKVLYGSKLQFLQMYSYRALMGPLQHQPML